MKGGTTRLVATALEGDRPVRWAVNRRYEWRRFFTACASLNRLQLSVSSSIIHSLNRRLLFWHISRQGDTDLPVDSIVNLPNPSCALPRSIPHLSTGSQLIDEPTGYEYRSLIMVGKKSGKALRDEGRPLYRSKD